MTPHTAASLAAMPGVELAELCAEGMGWIWCGNNDGRWLDSGGKDRYILAHDWSARNDFRPDVDANHAAELRAWACEKWGLEWREEHTENGGSVCGIGVQFRHDFSFLPGGYCVAVCDLFIMAARVFAKGER